MRCSREWNPASIRACSIAASNRCSGFRISTYKKTQGGTNMATAVLPQQAAMDSAGRYLIGRYTPKGNKIGWLMMAAILVEAWDLYSIAFVLIFIRDQYHPDPFMLGLANTPQRATRSDG